MKAVVCGVRGDVISAGEMVIWHEAPIVIPEVTKPHQLWTRPSVRLRLVDYKHVKP